MNKPRLLDQAREDLNRLFDKEFLNNCHFEYGEKSIRLIQKIPHYVRNDKCGLFRDSLTLDLDLPHDCKKIYAIPDRDKIVSQFRIKSLPVFTHLPL